MEIKPKKHIYSKKVQVKIYNISKKLVKDIIKNNPEIYLANSFGSIIKREMGVYTKVYDKKRYGSDIDIICIIDPKFIVPKKWKFIGRTKAFDVYDIDSVENYLPELGKKELPIHPIKFLLYNPKIHDYDEAMRWSAIDKKYSESQGFKVENWHINQEELNRVMKNNNKL